MKRELLNAKQRALQGFFDSLNAGIDIKDYLLADWSKDDVAIEKMLDHLV